MMGETDFVLPLASRLLRYTKTFPYVSVAPRTRRRCLVALTLAGTDLLAGLVAVHIAGRLAETRFTIGIAGVPVLILVYWALGLYEGFGPCPFERLRLRAQGIVLFAAADCATGIVAGASLRLGFLVPACLLLLIIGYYMEICARTVLIRHGLWGGATIFVGCGSDRRQLAQYLQQHPEFGLCPIGFIRMAQESPDQMPPSLPMLGGVADLEQLASRIEVLVFGSAADTVVLSPALRRRLDARQLVMVGEPHDVQSLWLRTRTLGGLIGVELRRDSGRSWNRRIKRLVDLAISVPACLVAAPVIGLAAVAIKAVDPGPVFYFQDRVGMDGQNLRVCKLRTMYKDAEQRLQEHLECNPEARAEWQRFFKLTRDPRILPVVGAFLRRTSIDELPQLWNVVCGQMSLVGPRPFPAYHVGSFDPEFQLLRSSVPPGLSGLWQVAARSNGDLDVQRTQDLFYILNWSIWLDLYILIETPVAVIAARGAR
jgi:Undecaprenyl-phosphate galactose phosphotransferase WbaP